MTATKHSTIAKHSQPAPTNMNDTQQQLEEYMDMSESHKEVAMSDAAMEQLEEYVEMNDNKGMQNAEQELEEYVDVNGKVQDSNKLQEGGSMYVDLETVQEYEVPVNLKKTSTDVTYL